MIIVEYPEPQFRIRRENDKQFIFDAIRKVWLSLTEEEWVRQNFVNYLITVLKYPSSIIAVEKEIMLYEMKKRFDILVYGREHKPWMLVECKAPYVSLGEDVLRQVLRYHISVPLEFIILTNGNATMGWRKEGKTLKMLEQLPEWGEKRES